MDNLILGLGLLKYFLERGCFPHEHAINLHVVGLCSPVPVEAAYECSTQVVERGRHLSKEGLSVLERSLVETRSKINLPNSNQQKKTFTKLTRKKDESANTVRRPLC